ncbi:hypothetical protein FisN_16Lh071 [Fistulifera solaris]|uniref:SnoaL-like domain-containing protein n=1 Tax=Fistulifera solaris TaxID=1519565 RepID=A0A1Z5KIY1_FISSO|nr:hypothetical protein FisN_16Lh071 [Fistulifera solaris]|eukprot:GAX26243.1 hypothetical protein FisN_16Lh071 [Fistulifera solaris]
MVRLIVLLGIACGAVAFVPTTPSPRASWALSASRARDLIQSLFEEHNCFSTEAGVRAFGDVCAYNVVYEDRFEAQPLQGKTAVVQHLLQRVTQKQGKGTIRLDKITDGDQACGFLWTWVTPQEEGLRGTTLVQLNEKGEIEYVSEFPEPLYKPGDATKDLLKALTAGETWKPFQPFEEKNPTIACELVKYLFEDLQAADPKLAQQYMMRFWSDNVVYHDFNFEEPLRGPQKVLEFTQDFSFPGITFRPLRYDDGRDLACFTWEVILGDIPDSIKGISFYELDPETRKIVYVRDIAESAIKPPILGKLARQLRPGLGVFRGVPLGSRRT